MFLSEIFTKKELETKVRKLYLYALRNKNIDTPEFEEKFEDLFGMSIKLTFGDRYLIRTEMMYDLCRNYYSNEWVVKIMLDKYLNINDLFFEKVIEENIVDAYHFGRNNNRSECYEIKTKYDTTKRLPKQIETYSKVFQYVNVVCCESKLKEVKKIVPDFVGIIIYKDRANGKLTRIRKPKKSPKYSIRDFVKLMTKAEKMNYFPLCIKDKKPYIDLLIKNYSEREIFRNHVEYLNENKIIEFNLR